MNKFRNNNNNNSVSNLIKYCMEKRGMVASDLMGNVSSTKVYELLKGKPRKFHENTINELAYAFGLKRNDRNIFATMMCDAIKSKSRPSFFADYKPLRMVRA